MSHKADDTRIEAPTVLRAALVIALIAVAAIALLLLVLVGRPLATEDLFFHLKMGQVFIAEGLHPQAEPMLHTVGSAPPVLHEWLFGVLVFGLWQVVGLSGLRVVHVIAVALLCAFALSLFRRQSKSALPPLTALAALLVLSTPRLMQLRPDLSSIAAALAVYRLVIEPESRPSWLRVALCAGVFLLWVNLHSLFAVGLALLSAATLGAFMKESLSRSILEGTQAVSDQGSLPDKAAPPDKAQGPSRALRLLFALFLSTAITFLNPRGAAQHLTFFASSDRALWMTADEWHRFFPFWPGAPWNSPVLGVLSWVVADAVMVAFLVAFSLAYRRFRQTPDSASVDLIDPPLFLLGAASIGAMLISLRFLWMGVFPLVYVLRTARLLGSGHASKRWAVTLATATVALAIAFPPLDWWPLFFDNPIDLRAYLQTPFSERRFNWPGVRFLADSGLSGNLFNSYASGGFLGWKLAPKLRTFIDGDTVRYPTEVMEDYLRISYRRSSPQENFLEILARRKVDLFFAVGGEECLYNVPDTLRHLEGVPGWLQVFRANDHAIYLRRDEHNALNLERVADYYKRLGVPFDPSVGFRVESAIRANPEWARAQGLLPRDYESLVSGARSDDPGVRFRALDALGKHWRAVGDVTDEVTSDTAAAALRPDLEAPRLRLVQTLVASGRPAEALPFAREVAALSHAPGAERMLEEVAAMAAREPIRQLPLPSRQLQGSAPFKP